MTVDKNRPRILPRFQCLDGAVCQGHLFIAVQMPTHEIVVVELRRMLLLPLDDLLAITGEFLNPVAPRFGVSRCLRGYEFGDLNALLPREPAAAGKGFKAYEPGSCIST